jgi:putative transposon-encoded protein
MRTIKIKNNDLEIKDKIETLFEKEVTKFGNGGKIDCPKKFLGKKALIIIRKQD